MARMRLLVILCPNHKKAWHQAPAEQGFLTALARLGGWGRNGLCWAAVIMAPATRGQQVPTGSLPGGPEPHPDLNPTDLPCRPYSSSRRCYLWREVETPAPSPSIRKITRKSCLLFYKVSCSAIWEGQFWGLHPGRSERKIKKKGSKGDDKRPGVAVRWARGVLRQEGRPDPDTFPSGCR